MTTEDANSEQPATETAIRDESAVAMSAPLTDTVAEGEVVVPQALTTEGEQAASLAASGGEDEQTLTQEDLPSLPGDEPLSYGEADTEARADSDFDAADDVAAQEIPEPPPPRPIQLVLWNEKVPASAGCWVFWREAGFECRGKIEKGLFTATCKGYGGSARSQPVEFLLRRRFVSQGEAIAVMNRTLAFDPHAAESLGFEIHGRAMIPFLPSSGALDEEQAAGSG